MEITKLYTFHALLQATAFLILFPIGIIIALTKTYIGSNWFILHIIFQSLGVFCVFAAIALMAYAQYLKNKDKNKESNSKTLDENKPISIHVIIGIIIVCLIIFQLLWAIFLRHTINREIWVLIHIILAILILCLGWTNLYLGYKLYRKNN